MLLSFFLLLSLLLHSIPSFCLLYLYKFYLLRFSLRVCDFLVGRCHTGLILVWNLTFHLDIYLSQKILNMLN